MTTPAPSGRRIVVAGGAGFLGSHLCQRLLDRGDAVVCVDNLVTGRLQNIEHLRSNPAFEFIHHDISNPLYVSGDVWAVMNLASPASPVDFDTIPIQILKVGGLGTYHLLGMAKAKGARFFLASTSEVYGDPLVHPQPETYLGNVNPIGPRGCYDEAKRYAEALTMAYHRKHGVDTRIVRIFNSVLASEKLLYDDGVGLRFETAAELARRIGDNADLDGYTVPGFADDGSMAARPAVAFVGHPPTGPCFEVRTRYGRTIRVTGDHSLFVRGDDGRPVARPVRELEVGDHVAIAGRLEVEAKDRRWVDVAEAASMDGRSPWELVVRCAGLGKLLQERRSECYRALAEDPEWAAPRSQWWGYVNAWASRDEAPLALLDALHIPVLFSAELRGKGSKSATALPAVIELTDEFLWFLGLFVAEGCVDERRPKSSFITIACDDGVLDRAQKVIERDLALHCVRSEETDQRVGALFVHSRLLVSVLRVLGFTSGEKTIPGWVLGLPLNRLKWFIEGYREGDGVHSGRKFEDGIRHEFSTTSERLKDDLVVALGRFGLVPSVGSHRTRSRKKTGDRTYPFWRLTLARVSPWSPLDWDAGVQQVLNATRFGDLVWARVTEIAEVEPTELVYDFCVPGFENFVAGTGVLAHNTYGPHMRADDGRVVTNFIVQALEGKPLTVFGDGSQTRSFCYVDDEVEGFIRLLDSDVDVPVNVGNPDTEHTVLDFAKVVLEVTGSSSEIVFEPLPGDDPMQRRPDITRARELLGWEPKVSLREGLARTADYFRESLHGQP